MDLRLLLLQFCELTSRWIFPLGSILDFIYSGQTIKTGDLHVYYLIRGNSVGYSCGITRIPGIPLPGPVPILNFLARSWEAGLVSARYPISSVTTVCNLYTFHCTYPPCPELAETQRFGEHRDSGSFPGFRSLLHTSFSGVYS